MKTPDKTAKYAKPLPGVVEICTASIITSFEKNPEKPGKPIKASEPIKAVQYVIGIYFFMPPILRMSCS